MKCVLLISCCLNILIVFAQPVLSQHHVIPGLISNEGQYRHPKMAIYGKPVDLDGDSRHDLSVSYGEYGELLVYAKRLENDIELILELDFYPTDDELCYWVWGGDFNGDSQSDIGFSWHDMFGLRRVGYLMNPLSGPPFTYSYFHLNQGNTIYAFSGDIIDNSFDCNGDGFDDVLLCFGYLGCSPQAQPNHYALYLGSADTTTVPTPDFMFFTDPNHNSVWHPSFDVHNIFTGDFNGDGYDDLWLYQPIYTDTTFSNKIYLGSSVMDDSCDVEFIRATEYFRYRPQGWLSNVDVNGDGCDDLVTTNYDSPDSIFITYGDPNLTFQEISLDLSNFSDNNFTHLFPCDINNDGIDDIGVPVHSDHTINILLGGDTIDVEPYVCLNLGEYYNGHVTGIGNFDGDEYYDIAVTTQLRPDGYLTFSEIRIYSLAPPNANDNEIVPATEISITNYPNPFNP